MSKVLLTLVLTLLSAVVSQYPNNYNFLNPYSPYGQSPNFGPYSNRALNNGPEQSQNFLSELPSIARPGPITRGGFSVKNASYVLEWEVRGPHIIFKARRRGIGFVGFALSKSGGMAGADIFIAGIGPDGRPFANDYHHEYQNGAGAAVPDMSNDYQVLDVSEDKGYTTARFMRLINTNDVQEDIAIENSVQNVLWSIGPPSRGLEYHGPTNRGVVRVNLLDPPPTLRLSRPI